MTDIIDTIINYKQSQHSRTTTKQKEESEKEIAEKKKQINNKYNLVIEEFFNNFLGFYSATLFEGDKVKISNYASNFKYGRGSITNDDIGTVVNSTYYVNHDGANKVLSIIPQDDDMIIDFTGKGRWKGLRKELLLLERGYNVYRFMKDVHVPEFNYVNHVAEFTQYKNLLTNTMTEHSWSNQAKNYLNAIFKHSWDKAEKNILGDS